MLFPNFHMDGNSHEDDEDYEEALQSIKNWKWKQFHSLVLWPCYTFEFTKNVSASGSDGEYGAWAASLEIAYDICVDILSYFHKITTISQCQPEHHRQFETICP